MISFKPLLKLLIDKEMSKSEFIEKMNISTSTAAKMWKNEYVAMKIVDDICEKFDCTLNDVIEYIPNKMNDKKEPSLND